MKHFSIITRNGELISENLIQECHICYSECKSPGKLVPKCPKYGDVRRQGVIINNRGTTFLCCNETTQSYLEINLKGLSYAFYDLPDSKGKV